MKWELQELKDRIDALEAALPRIAIATTTPADEPLDGHGIDSRLASALTRAWNEIVGGTEQAPTDFWVVDGVRLGFRPDILVARAGEEVERMIEDEVEKRLLSIRPVDAAAVPIDEREAAIGKLADLLQRVARVLPPERRRHRREIEDVLLDLGVVPEKEKAGARA